MDETDFSWQPAVMVNGVVLENWLAAVARGDRAAFASLYEATAPRLFGICLRLLGDRRSAEAALQDIFVRIGLDPEQFRVLGLDPMPWMITVTRNHCIVVLRGQRAAVRRGQKDIDSSFVHLPVGPDTNVVTRHHATDLLAGLAKLGPKTSEAIRRAYLEGETLRDMVARFNIPKDKLYRGLRLALFDLRSDLYR